MLKNAYLLAKIGADTAENEPNFAEKKLPKIVSPVPAARRRRELRALEQLEEDAVARAGPLLEELPHVDLRRGMFYFVKFAIIIFTNFCKFLVGSFSAVSKRNFARKYAFDSIFQALQDLHPFAPLQSKKIRKKSV